MDLRVIIMAGGAGTRFWPVSRKNKPKQFLPIVSEKTMIEETIDRLSPRVPLNNIYTIANPEKTETIKSLLPGLPDENFLVEPIGKNTAPSLILATARIYLQNPRAVLAALPADHLIKNSSLFLQKFEAAATAASSGDYLITFGVPPTHPATGYGYIRWSSSITSRNSKKNRVLNRPRSFLKKGIISGIQGYSSGRRVYSPRSSTVLRQRCFLSGQKSWRLSKPTMGHESLLCSKRFLLSPSTTP